MSRTLAQRLWVPFSPAPLRGLRLRLERGRQTKEAGADGNARRRFEDQVVLKRRCNLTKIGLWYVLFLIVLVLAATNTGNNALYMIIAAMIALLAVNWIMAWWNTRFVKLTLMPPHETFALSPVDATLVVSSTQRLSSPKWLALRTQGGAQKVVRGLDSDAEHGGLAVERRRSERAPNGRSHARQRRFASVEQEVMWSKRGRHRLGSVQVSSLYPLGLFRCLVAIEPARAAMVYPQLFEPGELHLRRSARIGESSVRKRGQGPELFGLRPFRVGDDPRSVHWKRSAQTGDMVVLEREAEESRRLSLLLDNAMPSLAPPEFHDRFETLVSEAATLGLDALSRGFEVELVTRTTRVGFGGDRLQRRRLLEALALLETCEIDAASAAGERRGNSLRLLRTSDPSAWTVRLALMQEDHEETA